jgi:hypothetical protein
MFFAYSLALSLTPTSKIHNAGQTVQEKQQIWRKQMDFSILRIYLSWYASFTSEMASSTRRATFRAFFLFLIRPAIAFQLKDLFQISLTSSHAPFPGE